MRATTHRRGTALAASITWLVASCPDSGPIGPSMPDAASAASDAGADAAITTCSSDADCGGSQPRCDLEARACVECLSSQGCAEGEECRDGACAEPPPCDLTQEQIEALCALDTYCMVLDRFDCTERTCFYVARDCDDGDRCTTDYCDESARACVNVPRSPSGAESGDYECSNGEDDDCDGFTDQEDPGCGGCGLDQHCDDQSVCTDDRCVDSACVFEPIASSLDCDDNDPCTVDDTCVAGACQGVPLDQDGDGHSPESCGGDDCDDGDPALHGASPELHATGTTCGDGLDNDCDGATDADDLGCWPALCSERWCWQNPLLHGIDVYSAWSNGEDDWWAVGDEGGILRWNGVGWSQQAAPNTRALQSVWAADGDSAWVVGADGAILRWDGVAWSAQDGQTDADLLQVRGASASDVWIAGQQGVLLHWDGAAWSNLAPDEARYYFCLAVAPDGEVWVGGDGGVVWHDAGTGWSSQTLGSAGNVTALWRFADGRVWAVTRDGELFEHSGDTWTLQPESVAFDGDPVVDLWAGGPEDAWVLVDRGFIGSDVAVLRWDGLDWTYQGAWVGGERTRATIVGRQGDAVWIAGSHGVMGIYRPEGATRLGLNVVPLSRYITVRLFDVWALDATAAWAAGSAGRVAQWNGASWTLLLPNNNSTEDASASVGRREDKNMGIWAAAPDELWVAGGRDSAGDGFLERWDGAQWAVIGANASVSFTDLWGSAADDLWLTGTRGQEGVLFRWDGMVFDEIVMAEAPCRLRRIHGSAWDDAWAVGDSCAWRWDGVTWSEVSLPCALYLHDVWTAGPTDAWVVAGLASSSYCAEGLEQNGQGVILRWDGDSWEVIDPGLPSGGGAAIWGSAPDDVWLRFGLDLLRWDGAGLTAYPGEGRYVERIGGAGDGAAWGVGALGNILRLRPPP